MVVAFAKGIARGCLQIFARAQPEQARKIALFPYGLKQNIQALSSVTPKTVLTRIFLKTKCNWHVHASTSMEQKFGEENFRHFCRTFGNSPRHHVKYWKKK